MEMRESRSRIDFLGGRVRIGMRESRARSKSRSRIDILGGRVCVISCHSGFNVHSTLKANAAYRDS